MRLALKEAIIKLYRILNTLPTVISPVPSRFALSLLSFRALELKYPSSQGPSFLEVYINSLVTQTVKSSDWLVSTKGKYEL